MLLQSASSPDVAGVFENIGTMHSARRKYVQAQEGFRRSYQIRLEAFGEAEGLLRDALQVHEKTFGSQPLQVVATLEKLTEVSRKTRREEEAVLMEERAKDIRFERDHVVRANALRQEWWISTLGKARPRCHFFSPVPEPFGMILRL
jgi:hypothetical protein